MLYFKDAFSLIIEFVFGFLILAMLFRFLFQLTKADFRNPLSQFIVKITSPILNPVRRFVPGLYGIDLAAVLLIVLLGLVKLFILLAAKGIQIAFPALLALSLADTINTVIWIFIIAILVVVVVSWVAPRSYHPAIMLAHSLARPVTEPFRRLLPSLGGLDFSPIIAMLALQLLQKLVVAPLADLGRSLM